ncbi:MAG TPA: hypothetical protein PLA01_06315 [Acetivibrio sp.]|mgnify:FL=1|nr:hypothetical protein [Acetivibrio sp.]
MLLFTRNRKKRNKPAMEEKPQKFDCAIEPSATNRPSSWDSVGFSAHISNHIGETVTLFVESGGMSGTGFTGVLLYANEVYVKLLVSIGPAPFCPLGNPCILSFSHSIKRLNPCVNPMRSMGAIAIIPVNRIVSFVHNGI